MYKKELVKLIRDKRSYLCVGLDTDITKIPRHLQQRNNAVFEFNKAIIDATREYCIGYKLNTAFYEAQGLKGWQAMEETVNYIGNTHFTIADAKRGDIGNTSAQYAKTFFETLPFDAVTVAPYMGEDSVKPFLEYEDKFTIVLGLTSNKGNEDFQRLRVQKESGKEKFLYEEVLEKVATWGTKDNLMFVIGATQSSELKYVRNIIPDNFLLVPGVGTQGGSLQEVSANGMNKECGLLVNVSRAIIYADNTERFADKAMEAAKKYQQEMSDYLIV